MLLLAAFGCTTEKRCAKKYPCSGVDSIRTEYVETVRDTIITIPGDSASITALLKCDSLGNVYIAMIDQLKLGTHVKPKIEIKNNWLKADCKVDSMQIYFHYKEKYGSSYRTITNTKIVEKKLSKYQGFMIESGEVMYVTLTLLLLAYIIYLVLKKVLKYIGVMR